MIMKKPFLMMLVLMVLSIAPAHGSPHARLFLDGVAAYSSGEYKSAVSAFETLAGKGVKNGELFYNLGNACLKDNRIGPALLWYERAMTLIPDDPDLKFNYDYALTLTKDEKKETENPIVRIMFFWKYQLSYKTIQWTAIALNALLWILVSVMIIMKKRPVRTPVLMLVAVAVVFTFTALYNYYEASNTQYAVVLPDRISVRSGLSVEATELFVLHAGTKIRIEKEHQAHFRIRYTKDKIGWIAKSDVGVI